MFSTRFAIAATLAAALGWAPVGLAQDVPDDDALDRLLEKVEGKMPDETARPSTKPDAGTPKVDAKAKPEASKDAADKKKGSGEVSEKDKALDDLLQQIGETKDEPTATGKPKAPPTPEEGPMPPDGRKPEDADAQKVGGKKDLDEHLEEILGRKKRKDDGEEDPSSGALAQAIKKMREVEQRLGQDDTGEQTRKRQKEIVQDLDTMIAQLKKAGSGSGRGRPGQRNTAGNQPGGQQDQPGNTGAGVGPQMPKKPTIQSILSDNKDEWGHLPPELRGEMENVFKEDALPKKKTLIDRYYLSVNKKSLTREK